MKLLYILLFITILSCNIVDDKSDTYFTKEIAAAKKNWGKDSLRLQTMYGFKLRMSKSEYEKHFDSLINVGISNKFKEIQFNGDFQSISVFPQFYNNLLMEIDFSLSDVRSYLDTNSVPNSRNETNMDEIITKLYGASKVYKEMIMNDPSDNSKISLKKWAYGWIENNRLINVSRIYMPSIDKEENWRFTSAVFTDLELKEKFDLNKKITDSIITKNEEEEKNKIFK
jgi:hypothetical protein